MNFGDDDDDDDDDEKENENENAGLPAMCFPLLAFSVMQASL